MHARHPRTPEKKPGVDNTMDEMAETRTGGADGPTSPAAPDPVQLRKDIDNLVLLIADGEETISAQRTVLAGNEKESTMTDEQRREAQMELDIVEARREWNVGRLAVLRERLCKCRGDRPKKTVRWAGEEGGSLTRSASKAWSKIAKK
jgi:hypothetical protein